MTATYLLKILICSESEDISLIQKQNEGDYAIASKMSTSEHGLNSGTALRAFWKNAKIIFDFEFQVCYPKFVKIVPVPEITVCLKHKWQG